jgi:hypothetical protein
MVLKPKPRKCRFEFEAQITKPSTLVLRPNHWQTITTSFEARLANPCFSSPTCVWCESHTVSPDLLIIYPPSTQLVPDHSWSSAPGLLLLPWSWSLSTMSHSPPTHHETSNRISPNRITQFRVSSTEMHRIQLQTKSNQLLIIQINQGTNHLVSHVT